MIDRVAYLCADAGIPPDGSKGASVHFRAMAQAFASLGTKLDVFMARAGDVSGFAPHRARTVPTPRAPGTAGEVLELLKEVGQLREAAEIARGGTSLGVPEQEVAVVDGTGQRARRSISSWVASTRSTTTAWGDAPPATSGATTSSHTGPG